MRKQTRSKQTIHNRSKRKPRKGGATGSPSASRSHTSAKQNPKITMPEVSLAHAQHIMEQQQLHQARIEKARQDRERESTYLDPKPTYRKKQSGIMYKRNTDDTYTKHDANIPKNYVFESVCKYTDKTDIIHIGYITDPDKVDEIEVTKTYTDEEDTDIVYSNKSNFSVMLTFILNKCNKRNAHGMVVNQFVETNHARIIAFCIYVNGSLRSRRSRRSRRSSAAF